METQETAPPPQEVADTKQYRKDLDGILQRIKRDATVDLSCTDSTGQPAKPLGFRASRERSIAMTKIQEAIMWLGMDLKAMKEEGVSGCENPYPQSYNPESPVIEPTADGLKL